jgi:glycosyltransferase involved in cell wall biosynthesis
MECKFADFIILDTYSHIKYFHEKFKSPLKKYRRVLIGAQDDIFHCLSDGLKGPNKFIIGFWGNFIPLQGVKYIIEAAKILENEMNLKIVLIGDGQEFPECLALAKKLNLKNIEFIGRVSLNELPKYILQFDIGLGIFGDTNKTIQVIPNKVFEGIAMNLPMISCDSPAIRELFTNNENIVLCERANPMSLANSILSLKTDEKLRTKIKINANKIFNQYCSTEAISKTLITHLNKILIK